jgi:nitrilase
MVKEYPVFKAAAVQAGSVFKDKPVYFDSKATLRKALDFIAEAGGNGAELIVFPEIFLPGFTYWSRDMKKGREFAVIWREYLRHSVEVPGEETEALCKAAKEANAYVVMGINERDKRYDGRMYNAILFISRRGEIMGVHRKLNPTTHELFFHTRGDGGDNLQVFETDLGKIGGLICGEHYQPALKQNLIIQGAQVNCSLWPGHKGTSEPLLAIAQVMTQALCISGGLWAVLASAYIPQHQVPKDFYDNNGFDNLAGGSCIINPSGEIVAGPAYDEETIVYHEIDLAVNPLAKSVINLTGIYSRWDVLSLGVRQRQYEPFFSLEDVEAGASARVTDELAELRAKIESLEGRLRSIEQAKAEDRE